MPTICVAVIVKNEEKNIEACLETAKWADEIVIVDDESTDRTIEICKKYTDKIFERKMDIEGVHRNFAYSKATTDWVLSLDADERITPELAKEIQETLAQETKHAAYAIPIKAYLGDHWIQGAGYYPARKVRLFQKGKFEYGAQRVHPPVKIDGTCGQLNGDIIHYSYDNFHDVINKMNRETGLEADKWIQDGRKVTGPKVVRKAISRFLKFYFQKGGIKHGIPGFMFSFLHSFYQILTLAKYWEMRRESQGE